jgi:predicted MFS family arabinose efflux permease
MNGRWNLVAAAFSLTALSYGLARFAYGLMLPAIREDLALGAVSAGWIGGGSFAAYCVGIVLAFAFNDRLGERRIAVLAGLAATTGMALISIAQSSVGLGSAIALAGLSTGLTSPPLAAAVSRCVEDDARARANGAINSGTAIGIVLSGVAALTFPGSWRVLYAAFAGLGAGVAIWLWFAMPKGAGRVARGDRAFGFVARGGLARLGASTFLAGAASAAIWTFGANIMRDDLAFGDREVTLAWIVLGAAGAIGAATGVLTDRYGTRVVHRLSIALLTLALVGLACASVSPAIAFVVMGLFGMSYIVATGTFLLWGLALYADRPGLGLGLPFLVLALGQTTGAPLFGAIWEAWGTAAALLTFAAIMAASAVWSAGAYGTGRRRLPNGKRPRTFAATQKRVVTTAVDRQGTATDLVRSREPS